MPKPIELVGDVGGSSSRWALLFDDGSVQRYGTERKRLVGFNPAVGPSTAFEREVGHILRQAFADDGKPKRVVVYGAGCGSPERAARMKTAVSRMLGTRNVSVDTDLMGAVRSTLGNGSGLVLILGTGMNAGWFHRGRLQTPMPSLGWMIGDEGSGADIGKHLLHDAMHGLVPKEVMRQVFSRARIDRTTMNAIMTAERPNAELAGLAWRSSKCERSNYTDELLASRFTALADLLDRYFAQRKAHAVHAVGGIAQAFNKHLELALGARGFRLVGTVADPMEGLIAWHQQSLPLRKSPAGLPLL